MWGIWQCLVAYSNAATLGGSVWLRIVTQHLGCGIIYHAGLLDAVGWHGSNIATMDFGGICVDDGNVRGMVCDMVRCNSKLTTLVNCDAETLRHDAVVP